MEPIDNNNLGTIVDNPVEQDNANAPNNVGLIGKLKEKIGGISIKTFFPYLALSVVEAGYGTAVLVFTDPVVPTTFDAVTKAHATITAFNATALGTLILGYMDSRIDRTYDSDSQ